MKLTEQPQLAVGVLGLGMLQIVSLFEATAPNLQTLRGSDANYTHKQELLDATILVGGVTTVVAFIATLATGSTLPAFMFLSGFAAVAVWHYLVLISPKV